MNPYAYIVRIEGIGTSDGQTAYCWPTVPAYASADPEYVVGLDAPPSGAGSRWDPIEQRMTTGGFTFRLRDGAGPVLFTLVNPRSRTELDEDHSAAVPTIDVVRSYTAAGLVDGDPMYVGRETILIGTIGVGDYQATLCTRGACGSTAQEHPDQADIYSVPPALTGRVVSVYLVRRDAASAASEVLFRRGQIEGEPAWSLLHGPTIQCLERFGELTLGNPPLPATSFYWNLGGLWTYYAVRLGGGLARSEGSMGLSPPRTRSDGGYYWLPDEGVVVAAAYDGVNWTIDQDLTIAEVLDQGSVANGAQSGAAYPIVCSNADLPYPSFGVIADPVGAPGVVTRGDHPCNIALNILLSKNGANYTVGQPSYDLGGHVDIGTDYGLYPTYALGIPIAQVDVSAFERVRDGDLAGMRARWLWLGGEEGIEFEELMLALFGPWGFTVGTTRDGQWTLVRLGDVYPAGSTVDLTQSTLADPDGWTAQVQGRSIDRIVIECGGRPDGKGSTPITIVELDARAHYPPNVGAEVRFERAPYDTRDLDEESIAWSLVAARGRRLTGRLQFVSVMARRASQALSPGLIDVGDDVTILDPGVRDPTTGLRQDRTSGTALSGTVVSSSVDEESLDNRLTIALMGSPGRLSRFAPSATVIAWDAGTKTATVEQHDYTRAAEDEDADKFAATNVCKLLADTLEQVAGSTSGIVSSLSATTLVFAVDDFTVAPIAGDVITWAEWDLITTGQQVRWAYGAKDGAAGTDPALGVGNDEPYVYGDGG